jgi:copper(I)-binding protein
MGNQFVTNSLVVLGTATAMLGGSVTTACDLKVESAWIRQAPPNAATLAGYAILKNVGNKSLSVVSIDSSAFAAVELHESITANGVASMRTVDKLVIGAGGQIEFAPNGKHFMLIAPKQALQKGDAVNIKLKDSTGCVSTTSFKVSTGALDKTEMDHSKMDDGMSMGK